MTTAAPMKIRCYNCNQLLGVNRNKAGGTISCPKCAAELTVPGLDAFDVAQFSAPAVEEEPKPPGLTAAAILGEEVDDVVPLDLQVVETPVAVAPRPAATLKIAEPPRAAVPAANDLTIPPIQIATARKLHEPKKTANLGAGSSQRDLLIPRSVVAAWSLLVLMAVAFAFLGGLLAGHFVWQVH